MRLSEYASTQRTYGSRKVPRSVQQSIPIDQIYEDGTWRCGNVYSQMWSMPDINFTMSDEDNKAKILNLLGKVYMGVPSDCWLKICIVSQRMDEKSFRENVLLHRNLDGLDKWRVERNRRIRQCVQDAGNVVQHKYLILSTNKQNVTDARSRLRQVQGNLLAELSNLGCTIKPMTNNERLEVLHNFFRRGEEGRFQFSFDDYGKLGNDFRNTIAPDAMRCTTQYAKIDDGFAKAMTIAQYPQQLSDNFVATLLQQVPYIVLSIDITPVETEDAMREIEASQMKIDSEKYRANRRNVENLDFMATISPRNQQQEKYTAEIRNAMRDLGSKCNVVEIYVRDNELSGFTRRRKLDSPTNVSIEIARIAFDLFKRNYSWPKPLRSIGVRGADLCPADCAVQLGFFSNEEKREKLEHIDKAVDTLRQRYGYRSVQRAVVYTDPVLGGINAYDDHNIHPVGYFHTA